MANLREAFEYASQNPNSDFANNLKSLAASGSLNMEAKKYNIDLTSFQPQPEPKKKESPLSMQPVRDAINQTADINNRLEQEYNPLAARTQQVLNTGAGAINALAELPGVRKITRPLGDAFSKVIQGAQDLGGDALYKTAIMFNDKAFQEQNEDNDGLLADIMSATGNLSTIAGTIAGVKSAPTAFKKVASVTGVDVIPDKVINYARDTITARNIQNNVNILENIDSSYAGLRKLDAKNRAYNQKPRQAAAESGYLRGSVDENGVIRTIQENGAVERMRKERIEPVEATVAEKLAEENRSIAVADVVKKLQETIKASGVKGVELKNALNSIQGDIDGLLISARDMGAPDGTIPVSLLHETKIAKGKAIDYTNLSAQDVGKARVRAFKELVENNADFDVRSVNKGLSEHYALDEYLRKLDGKRVEGGRLGKYGAKVAGSAVGGALGALFGPVGSAAGVMLGSEVGQALKERSMKNTFSKGSKKFTQPVVKPESPTLLLSENASKTNAISKDAIPVLPRDSFGETRDPNVVPASNSGKPVSTRIQNSTPTQGFDPLKMSEPRLPAGDYTTSTGKMYQPTVEQEAMFRDIEITQDIANNLPNIIDDLNNMDRVEAISAIDEATGELETSLSILEEQLSEMIPEKRLYILRKQMKEGTFSDRDFNPRDGNKLKLNSQSYRNKSDTTQKRNLILESLGEQSRLYGFDDWDQNADLANAAADMYEKTRNAYLEHKASLDVLTHKKKLMESQPTNRSTITRSTKNNINSNIPTTVPETTPPVKRPAKNMFSGSSPGFANIGGEMKDVTRYVDKANPYSKAASFLDETDRAPIEEFRNAVKNKLPISRKLTDDVDNIIEAINNSVGKQLINPYATDLSKMKQLSLLKEADDALTTKAISAYDKAQARAGTPKKSPVTNDLVSEAKKYKSAEELTNLNPTGGLNVDYTPEKRMQMKIGNNITTLSETMKKSPDSMITIYRGAPKSQKSINPGDFITTDMDIAKSYTGDGNVLSKRVRAGDILDDIEEPLGGEYLYRPGASSEIAGRKYDYTKSDWFKNYTDYLIKNKDKFNSVDEWVTKNKASGKTKSQLTEIWNKANKKK